MSPESRGKKAVITKKIQKTVLRRGFDMKNKMNQLLFVILLLPVFLLLLLPCYSAETWSGPNGGGKNTNSSPSAVGSNLSLGWIKVLDHQSYGAGSGTGLTGCIRSKNLAFRNGEFVLITPNSTASAVSDMSIFDAATGNLKKSFSTVINSTTRGDRNSSGTEGRDLNMGQFNVNWNQNGNVYFRSPGDMCQLATYRASDGQAMATSGPDGANQSAFNIMNDNTNFGIVSGGGHYPLVSGPYPTSINIGNAHTFSLDTNGSLVSGRGLGYDYIPWSPTYLIDNGWVYVLHYNLAIPMISAMYPSAPKIIAYQFAGNTSTASDIALTTKWNWTKADARVNADLEGSSALKPWCLGTNNIYFTTMTSNLTNLNPSSGIPVDLSAINRATGATVFTIGLNFDTLGVGRDTFYPQIACLNSGGTDYVATMLPEVYGASTSRTKIAMLGVSGSTPSLLWNYAYPNNGNTTPLQGNYANIGTSTKMVLAGDALFVAYVKTTTPLTVGNLSPGLPWSTCTYLDARNEYPLELYIDRFDLATGSKTSTNYSLGVNANTRQLDDFVAVDGKLYALVTYRENGSGVVSSSTRGAQLVAMVGGNGTSSTTVTVAADSPTFVSTIYPNPVNFNTAMGGTVKIRDLPVNCVMNIYSISGEKIRTLNETDQLIPNTGYIEWDGKNEGGEIVKQGIYMYVIKTPDGKKSTGKIAVKK
jgi:hypothetical protein